MPRFSLHAVLAALVFCLSVARADVEVPPRVLEPLTAVEAWNVIRLASANFERLIAEGRPLEVATQVSLCSPSIRALVRLAPTQDSKVKLDEIAVRAFGFINNAASGSLANDPVRTEAACKALRGALDEMATLFDRAIVGGEVYICPEDPDVLATDLSSPCPKCQQKLLPRRIPYSFVYTAPGPPTLKLAAKANAPVVSGHEVAVTLRLSKADGSPVVMRDLLLQHLHRVQVLVVDPSLTDFQRHHPEPTDTPGEYRFTFTPRLSSPYRVCVDVVPAATGLPELLQGDLPSTGSPGVIVPLDDTRTSTAGGLTFRLSFDDRRGLIPRQRESRIMRLTVQQADGQPMTKLSPYMQSFAHLSGFYEDGSEVLRLHPEGAKILRDDILGGPVLSFRLFAPKPGRIRFFAEVKVEGKVIVAPIDLSIAP